MENLVKCDDCKHLIEKIDAQFIESNWSDGIYFCPLHKKNCRYIMVYPLGARQYFKFQEISKQEANL